MPWDQNLISLQQQFIPFSRRLNKHIQHVLICPPHHWSRYVVMNYYAILQVFVHYSVMQPTQGDDNFLKSRVKVSHTNQSPQFIKSLIYMKVSFNYSGRPIKNQKKKIGKTYQLVEPLHISLLERQQTYVRTNKFLSKHPRLMITLNSFHSATENMLSDIKS